MLGTIVNKRHLLYVDKPHAGSAVVRIDPLTFLAGCRTRRLHV